MSETHATLPSDRSLVQRMLPWLRPHTGSFALALGLLLFSSGAKMLGPVILQQAVDRYIVPGNFGGLARLLGAYAVLVVLGFVANYLEIIRLEQVGQRLIADLKQRAFAHLLKLELRYFDQQSTGKLVSRIENDANALKVLFSTVITNILGNFVVVLGMFGIMAWQYDLRLAVYIVGLCPLILIAALLFNRWMKSLLLRARKQLAEVNGLITEIIQGIATIQIFGQQQRFIARVDRESHYKYGLDSRMTVFFNSFFNSLFFVQTLGVALVLWFGGQMVMQGQLSVGSLILFMVFIRTFFVPIMFLSSQFNEFQKALAAASRLFDLLDQPAESEVSATENNPAPSLPPGPYTLEFKGVWFRYSPDSDWVLQDLSFVCPAGAHWAVVGPTGSGKSTLISLLMRFYEPQQGQILLNGIDIRSIPRQTLRAQLGLVLQDVIFFPGSIARNLLLGQELSEAEVQQTMAQIGLDEVIQRLPQGYQTEVQEGARNLSEGERQLLSFGRALLRKPQILILDEATSHIDPQSEARIQQAMQTLLAGRTALIIAHRLSTIEQADGILVLQYGRLVEQGSHSELMKARGVYAEMRTLQMV
ncbi:MAG: ABC transporter ATP-binding protein [Candidatus Sericytochromatia bacterium]|nr:ABC transporter ATP-binding protein [Candidatus Sericytochromatia bacterium]